jgi:hypothetical protein
MFSPPSFRLHFPWVSLRKVKEVVMTLTTKTKRTQTTRAGALQRGTSGAHQTKPTRRVVHRSQEQGARSQGPAAQNAAIIIDDAFLAEVRDWTVLAGASLAAWMVAAIAVGAV